jgi:hypothetical protein
MRHNIIPSPNTNIVGFLIGVAKVEGIEIAESYLSEWNNPNIRVLVEVLKRRATNTVRSVRGVLDYAFISVL